LCVPGFKTSPLSGVTPAAFPSRVTAAPEGVEVMSAVPVVGAAGAGVASAMFIVLSGALVVSSTVSILGS
jgi:hypothetical protein